MSWGKEILFHFAKEKVEMQWMKHGSRLERGGSWLLLVHTELSFVFITERRIIQEEKRESVRICEKLVSGICFSLEDHEWTEMDKAGLSIK